MENTYNNPGLSYEQVNQRIKNKQTNDYNATYSKTNKEIIKDNIFSTFNIINTIVFVALLLVQAYLNTFFYLIVIANTLTSIIQEIRAKKTVEKLSIVAKEKVQVIRDNQIEDIHRTQLVVDDIMILEAEDQVVCDCVIQEGSLEINESLLTGESKSLYKYQNDELLSGSFIISGNALVKIKNVGANNFAEKIAIESKKQKQDESILLQSMNKLIKLTTLIIVPAALLLLLTSILENKDITTSVITSSASIIGMLPTGVVLLITASMSIGVTRLAKYNVLVQQLSAIENLSRVDMLCLDKTGTLTQGKMQVVNIYPLSKNTTLDDVNQIMKKYLSVSKEKNSTYKALIEYFKPDSIHEFITQSPFNSQKKWSSTSFKDITYYLGAPEILTYNNIPPLMNELVNSGQRIILLGSSEKIGNKDVLNDDIKPIALITMLDPLRDSAAATISYFKKQGVNIKIISGDNPKTVSKIASDANIDNASKYIDLTNIANNHLEEIANDYTVFGRANPEQKRIIIKKLQSLDYTVGMTGDGVNDVLALKSADCSIAMGKGADAAISVAQLVLLDLNFDVLPMVVNEGRRVINNITRVAPIYFVKTIYSGLFTLFSILLSSTFPFIPIQVTLINACIVGIPSIFLTFEWDNTKIKNNFLVSTLARAIPNAITIFIMYLVIHYLPVTDYLSEIQKTTLLYTIVAFITYLTVIQQSKPLSIYRYIVLMISIILFTTILILNIHHFRLEVFNLTTFSYFLLAAALSLFILKIIRYPIINFLNKSKRINNLLIKKKK
ncbi:HAD-IC family P-type ATPase [Mycoplasma sp. P36-A1]|uniref:HAD-IC family P-type ATPase n=1 Tax=Mycoplasma sp. P36-A1 TaxID=3252900 RepID=UPI003C30C724